MTREELINQFQKWLDTKPRKQIIAAECANIAENYASEREKQLRIGGVSQSVAKEWGEFIIRCDREGRPLLLLEDYIEQYCG